MKRVLIAVLLIVLLISCEQLSFADTAYSTTAPKILFPSQPTAVLYGKNRMAYSYLSVNNEGTITRHSHTFGKLHAIALDTCWKIRYLRRPTHNEVDEEYRKTLCRNVLRVALKKAYYVLYHSIKKRS